MLFFQMSVQVNFVPGHSVSVPEKSDLFGMEKQTYPMNYLLHVGVKLTIIKVFNILFLLVRIGNILAISKINQ